MAPQQAINYIKCHSFIHSFRKQETSYYMPSTGGGAAESPCLQRDRQKRPPVQQTGSGSQVALSQEQGYLLIHGHLSMKEMDLKKKKKQAF